MNTEKSAIFIYQLHIRFTIVLIVAVILLSACASRPGENDRMIIAHRGGVVDDRHAENSIKALEAAIRRGYTHVEVDARITADGQVVCFHEDDLREVAGIEGRISELPADSVTRIVLPQSQETIPTFAEYVARCAGRIGLMVDLKGCPDRFVDRYAAAIEAALEEYGLLEESLLLINKTPINNQDRIIEHFLGRVRISWRRPASETQLAARKDPDFHRRYYVFNHGADFTREEIRQFQELGLPVIVSINTGHYRTGDPQTQGEKHIEQMIAYGADGLQIDSRYDHLLFDEQ